MKLKWKKLVRMYIARIAIRNCISVVNGRVVSIEDGSGGGVTIVGTINPQDVRCGQPMDGVTILA
jgi:hypothetical protein